MAFILIGGILVFVYDIPIIYDSSNQRLAVHSDFDVAESVFPSLHITTIGEEQPFEERLLWINSTFTLLSESGHWDFESETGRIRGRGNSSWEHPGSVEKRPLRLRFDRPRQMINSGHFANDWILIANHFDYSLLRNYSAHFLANSLSGLCWAPFTHFVHLYVNDVYMGVYLLVDERLVGIGRLDLVAHQNPAQSEFLLQMEWSIVLGGGQEGIDFIRVNSAPGGVRGYDYHQRRYGGMDKDFIYEVRYPHSRFVTSNHMEYVRDYLTRVGMAIRTRDFEEIQQLIDIDSFADFYIIYELFREREVIHRSFFMQIKGTGENRRLHLGPVWDFDFSAGIFCSQRRTSGFAISADDGHYWFYNLMRTPEFFDIVQYRWHNSTRYAVKAMVAHIHDKSLAFQSCFERNFIRFPILGTGIHGSMNTAVVRIESFVGQVDFLTNFLETRSLWLDDVLRLEWFETYLASVELG